MGLFVKMNSKMNTSKQLKPFSMNQFYFSKFMYGYLAAGFAWVLTFLIPLVPFFAITASLVGADMYTGIKAARKRNEKILFSNGIRRTIEKTTIYFIAILLSEGMVQVFNLPINLTYAVAFLVATAEFISNIENIEEITGTPLTNAIKDILRPKK